MTLSLRPRLGSLGRGSILAMLACTRERKKGLYLFSFYFRSNCLLDGRDIVSFILYSPLFFPYFLQFQFCYYLVSGR